ncbi:MAG: hypothetical protein ACHQDE_06275, partial [Acidimicrobiia bacterium]
MANTLQQTWRGERYWEAELGTPTVAGQERRPLSPWAALAVLALVGGVVPVALAGHFGALGIPRHDDWSYALAAFRFADRGRFNGNG